MTEEEARQYVKRAAAHTKEIAASPSKSRKLLEKAGIISSTGELKRPYSAEKKTAT